MKEPKLITIAVEVSDELLYYAGFNAAEAVEKEMHRYLAGEICKHVDMIPEVSCNSYSLTKTFHASFYCLTRKELQEIIDTEVNRSHAGIPPRRY